MKRMIMICIAILLIAAPAAIFASDGIWVGPTALYGTAMTFGELDDANLDFDVENFNYGLEARLDISIFQASMNAVYYKHYLTPLGDFMENLQMDFQAGLYADLGIVGLGLSAGPKYIYFLDEGINEYLDEAYEIGSSMKLTADLILGDTLLSAYFIGGVDDMDDLDDEDFDLDDMVGKAGFSVLFKL